MVDRNWFRAWCVCAAVVAGVWGPTSPAARGQWFVDGPDMPAEACESYALVEALAMQRTPGGGGPLVLDSVTQLPVFTGDTLDFAMAPGLRVLYGRHGACALGWEVGYVGVYGMVADDEAIATTGIYDVMPPLSDEVPGLRNAYLSRARYTSQLDSVEANLLLTQQNWRPARVSAYAKEDCTRVVTWDWLAGFRWAGLNEAAALTMTQPGGLADSYSVRTGNNLFAGQIGFRGRADWGPWALDGWLKAGLAGAALTQSQAPIIDTATGDVFRSARSADTGAVAGIFDLDIALVRRINETWAIRAGWNSIWLTGVALATQQFDFSNEASAGTVVADGGSVWLNGLTLGVEGRW